MIMRYGGFLVMSGLITDKKTGKNSEWQNIKVLLSPDGSRAGLYKMSFSDAVIPALRSIPLGVPADVSFDFYGNVEKITRIEGGGNHA